MNRTLASLLPQFVKAAGEAKAMKVVKKGGWCGVLVALGGLIEGYGPELARWALRLTSGH